VTPELCAAIHAASFARERAWSPHEFAALLDDPNVFSVEVAEGGEAGFALGRAVAGEAELLTLAVAPLARRRGHGRALLAAFELAARERGAGAAFLEVAADNAAAVALYTQAGYTERGRRPGYYVQTGGGVDALVMGRALA
jgi:ribosomal-protein-alanine N-acetyltransferase